MTTLTLQRNTLSASSGSTESLLRGYCLSGSRGAAPTRARRFFAGLKTFSGLSAAAALWIATAVFVACPDKIMDLSQLAPSFFGSDGTDVLTHANILAILVIADIFIATIVVGDEGMRHVVFSRIGFGISFVCIAAFLLADFFGLRQLRPMLDHNGAQYLLAALVLICIPRGLSYWRPQGKAQPVRHSVGGG